MLIFAICLHKKVLYHDWTVVYIPLIIKDTYSIVRKRPSENEMKTGNVSPKVTTLMRRF